MYPGRRAAVCFCELFNWHSGLKCYFSHVIDGMYLMCVVFSCCLLPDINFSDVHGPISMKQTQVSVTQTINLMFVKIYSKALIGFRPQM